MEQTTAKGRGIRPFMSWVRHWRWSVWFAFALFVLGLPLVWIKGASQYNAEATFQVSPIYQKNLTGDKELEIQSNAQYREFVGHLSKTVLRRDIVQTAIEELIKQKVSVCLPAENERQCTERIQRTVYVLPVAESYIVRVGYTSENKYLPEKLVNAIMAVFVSTVREEQIFGAEDRFSVLHEQEEKLNSELNDFLTQRTELASLLGLTTFTETVANPYDSLLSTIREKQNLAKVDLSQANATLKAFKSQREVPVSAGKSVLDMRLQDSGLQTLRNEVIKRSEELNRNLAGLETKHPARQSLKDELQEINTRLLGSEKNFEHRALENVEARLNASVLQATQVEKELAERVNALTDKAGWYADIFREAMRLTGHVRKREEELAEIRNRVNFIHSEKSALGFVRMISPALPAMTPQGPGKFKLLLALLGSCLMTILALPIARDMLDRRVMAVADAEKAMDMPCAAWIIDIDDLPARLLAQQQIQRFASTLLRLKRESGNAIFGFTSVKVGGGVTGLTLDLAVALQRQGSRVLVVDANSLNESSVGAHTPGLVNFLKSEVDLAGLVTSMTHGQYVVPYVHYGSDRSCGIVRLDLLQSALASWHQVFDFVLLDLPPFLPSADAELLTDAISQVFVVVEAMSVHKRDLMLTRQKLLRQKVSSVGLVVTRVPLWLAESGSKEHLIELISRSRADRFMTNSWLRLKLQVWQLQLQKIWLGLKQRLKRH